MADPAPQIALVQRPARALVGWMTEADALSLLNGQRTDVQPTDEQRELVRQAQATAQSREAGVASVEVIPSDELPEAVSQYVHGLGQNDVVAGQFAAGWEVCMVDLRAVCGAQPMIHTDRTEDRTEGVDPGDPAVIASVTLPTPGDVPLAAGFDGAQRAWVFTSANPNLQVFGHAAVKTDQGNVFGFMVGVPTSFVRVVRYQGRLILTDGYHRAYGLLRRGVGLAPVMMREVVRFDELGLPPVGMLPQDAFLGERPPILTDYLDDRLAIDVSIAAAQKSVVIPALQFMSAV